MSQWGEERMAAAGKSWRQIIAFYYPGTALATSHATIRVGVSSHLGSLVKVRAVSGLAATDGVTTVALPTTIGTATVSSWNIAISSWASRTPVATTPTGSFPTLWYTTTSGAHKAYQSTTGTSWTFSSSSRVLVALNSQGSVVAHYLGLLRGVRAGGSIVPVVVASLDDYVRQVVPYESFGSWPVQALAAQAVAARSYGRYYVSHPRSAYYDICDTTACQVMGGLGNETANSLAGVRATSDQIITWDGAAAYAEFGSSNGGLMAAGDHPYEVAKADPYDATLPFSQENWRSTVSASWIQAYWPSLGTVRSVSVVGRTGGGWWGGRVTAVRIVGSKATRTVSGTAFASMAGLRSNYFTFIPGPDSNFRDSTGDGWGDVLSISPSGVLSRLAGAGQWSLAAPSVIGTGYGTYRLVSAGQFGSDRLADLLLIDSAGRLYDSPSNGSHFGSLNLIGSGFDAYDALTVVRNFDGNGRPVILARRKSDGALVRFEGNASGALASSTPKVISPSGWKGSSYTAFFGSGDFTGDGHSDLVVRTSDGTLWAWRGNGKGGLTSAVKIGAGWGSFSSLASPGDLNGDGKSDIVASYSNGKGVFYYSHSGGYLKAGLPSVAAGSKLVS